jgi:anti-anti-sigma factor
VREIRGHKIGPMSNEQNTRATLRVETSNARFTTVFVSGRLDAAGVAAVEGAVAKAAEAAPGGRLALDLAGVPYLASVGLRLLMTTSRVLEKRGGRLVAANPTPEVEGVLAIAGLEKALRVCAGAAVAKAFG